MDSRLSSSNTLLEGMDKVEHKGDSDVASSRKRELQDKIKVT